ncbi:MAG: 2-C-methyl-D-erythritol 2,4-cyclodiphosphate synthase, partial [Planctomycetes bacterium]|nr:2-C-methyl-D-erythritol 2,4-cyclodiphosphate synthase [Planctomycetota bacterium]
MRIGLGEDTHRLAEGGPLRLGGVDIPHDRHALGHSDADVLLHAVTDAVLGAAGLADIGELFPDTDAANKNRDSAEMLHLAHERIAAAGFQ